MLFLGIFSFLTAVALPFISIPPYLYMRIASILLLYTAFLSLNCFKTTELSLAIYHGLFQITDISQWIDTFIFFIGAIILMPRVPLQKWLTIYPLIILFSVCGASFLISSADLISLYLSIELQSFAVYILAALYRESESATAAGLKYFLLGGLSSALILLGSALIYYSTGITQLENIFSLVSFSDYSSSFGFIFLFVGFLFKVSAAPFHNWAPDVYDGVPTIVTTWLTIMPKISLFILFLELSHHIETHSVLLFSSFLSLIIGTVLGLAQYRIKRLLAYSTISHVGFLLLALSINSEESIQSFIFYLIQYTLTNLNVFLIILAFGYVLSPNWKDIQFIQDLKGQFKYHPLLSLAFALCLFSIAGVPPLIGFFGKQMVLYSATHSGYYFLSIVAILTSVISATYYLKIIRTVHFETTESQITQLSNVHSFIIALLTLTISLFVLKPSLILNSTSLLALSLFYS